jgi:hypothetical protein
VETAVESDGLCFIPSLSAKTFSTNPVQSHCSVNEYVNRVETASDQPMCVVTALDQRATIPSQTQPITTYVSTERNSERLDKSLDEILSESRQSTCNTTPQATLTVESLNTIDLNDSNISMIKSMLSEIKSNESDPEGTVTFAHTSVSLKEEDIWMSLI